jgi:hypothetical protein
MCKGVRFPYGYGHDGNVNARRAGTTTADVYRRLGAPMLGKYATNSDGKNNNACFPPRQHWTRSPLIGQILDTTP